MIVKLVYKDDEETKVKKGEFIKEDMYTITIRTHFKEITVGKCNLVEMSEVKDNGS